MRKNIGMLPLAIGSLPHADTESAITLIRETMPQTPHWPQLPHRNAQDTMVKQYAFPLINSGLVTDIEGKLFFDPLEDHWQNAVANFYQRVNAIKAGNPDALDFFAIPEDAAQGFYDFIRKGQRGELGEPLYTKGQITGPITLATQITDSAHQSAYYSAELRDIIVKSLALQAYWQTKTLSPFGRQVILFIDEPGLYAFSGKRANSVHKQQITAELNVLIDAIHQADGLAGIHVCASTDWSMIFASQTDIVNFDGYDYFAAITCYPEQVAAFLERGGTLAWGLIPTNEIALALTSEEVLACFYRGVDELAGKGVPKERLLQQALITPTCGLGNCSVIVAERVYRLTGEAASKIWKK